METKSYFTRIQELKGKARLIQKHDEATMAELEGLYKAVFKDSIKKGCGDCAVAAYGKLIRLNEDQVNNMSTKKFVLKKNAAIQLEFGSADMISNETLTDELAIRLLKQRPKLLSQFEKYPADETGKVILELIPSVEETPDEEDESNDPDASQDTENENGEVNPNGLKDGNELTDTSEVKDSNGGTDGPRTEAGTEENSIGAGPDGVQSKSTGEESKTDSDETDQPGQPDAPVVTVNFSVDLKSQLEKAKAVYDALPKNEKLSKQGQAIKKQIDEFSKQLEG